MSEFPSQPNPEQEPPKKWVQSEKYPDIYMRTQLGERQDYTGTTMEDDLNETEGREGEGWQFKPTNGEGHIGRIEVARANLQAAEKPTENEEE